MYVEAPTEPPRTGADQMPRIGITDAVRREWPLAIAPVVALVLLALFVGIARSPVYTSEARLTVGQIDLRQPGALQGFVTATQSLASSYSRAITAEAVNRSVAARLGISPEEVAARVSATPIPESSVFRVAGTGDSPADAELLADTASTQLIAYVNGLNAPDPSPQELLKAYEDASLTYNDRAAVAERARERFYGSESASDADSFARADAALGAAKLRRDSLQSRYRLTQQSQTSIAAPRVLSPASGATSDRLSTLQLLLFIALASGAAAGLALALFSGNRQLRRDLLG